MASLKIYIREGLFLFFTKICKIFLPFLAICKIFFTSLKYLKFVFKGINRIISEGYYLFKSSLLLNKTLSGRIQKQKLQNPFDTNKKTIFIVITCGQAVRTFLLTDVLSILREKYNIVIVSPFAVNEDFVKSYTFKNVHVLPWFDNFNLLIEKILIYYHMIKSPSETHKYILKNILNEKRAIEDEDSKYYALFRLVTFLDKFFSRKFLYSIFNIYIWTFLSNSLFKKIFKEYNPKLVILTAAHHSSGWPLTYYAKLNGCETLANIISWDNLSTKGMIDASCGHYSLWSEEMVEEKRQYFPFIKSKDYVVGSPQFDIYFDKTFLMNREDFLKSVGLNPSLPYILYTTNTPTAMPDEPEILKLFWDEIEQSEISGKVSLLIRLHPKDRLERYWNIKMKRNLAITLAGVPKYNGADSWIPDREDIIRLVNTMHHAAVSINVASTMSLESFCVKIPTINVAFNTGNYKKKYLWSFDMYHRSTHYRALIEENSVAIAKSMKELVELTIDALKNKTKRLENMNKVLKQKVTYCEGDSAKRFCKVIYDILEKK